MIFRVFNRFTVKKCFSNQTRKFSIMESYTPSAIKFVWVDCEMTGLDVEKDTLLEVACVITDSDLKKISECKRVVIHQPKEILDGMNDWCQKFHRKTGLYQESLESKCSIKEAEQQLLTHVRKHTEKGKCHIAGNSVYMDVLFLRKHMSEFVSHAHYRLLDVSTLKILSSCWYKCSFEKKKLHDAVSDINESMEELKYFRENIFKNNLESK